MAHSRVFSTLPRTGQAAFLTLTGVCSTRESGTRTFTLVKSRKVCECLRLRIPSHLVQHFNAPLWFSSRTLRVPIGASVLPSVVHNRRADLRRSLPVRTTLQDRKSTRLNSSHSSISYAVFCLKK